MTKHVFSDQPSPEDVRYNLSSSKPVLLYKDEGWIEDTWFRIEHDSNHTEPDLYLGVGDFEVPALLTFDNWETIKKYIDSRIAEYQKTLTGNYG